MAHRAKDRSGCVTKFVYRVDLVMVASQYCEDSSLPCEVSIAVLQLSILTEFGGNHFVGSAELGVGTDAMLAKFGQ